MSVHPPLAPAETQPGDLEQYRKELTGYCYRMLGSVFEADDAVQDTMIKAWQKVDSFEGRSSVRSWLYRIATNVCLDMLRGRKRRALPVDFGSAWTPDSTIPDPQPEATWMQPMPDERVLPETSDPAELAVAKETIRMAFVTALQHLPARQRAVLILREVLRWQATEVAELLDTSVASVNSALQRARATLADVKQGPGPAMQSEHQELLRQYIDAFERYDVAKLVTLLHDDAVLSMPPVELWLHGPEHIADWFLGQGCGCRGARLVPTAANGGMAFGNYRVDPAGGWSPFAIQLLEVADGKIIGHHNYRDPELFEVFGLPPHLD